MTAIPPLSLSSGPSAADGQAGSSGTTGTGDFVFKGSSSRDTGSMWPLVATGVLAGGALWLALRN